MTKLLEEAFAAASRLPPPARDALALAVLTEVQAEPLSQGSSDRSADTLARFAKEALEEYRAGSTEPLDPNAL